MSSKVFGLAGTAAIFVGGPEIYLPLLLSAPPLFIEGMLMNPEEANPTEEGFSMAVELVMEDPHFAFMWNSLAYVESVFPDESLGPPLPLPPPPPSPSQLPAGSLPPGCGRTQNGGSICITPNR